MIIGRAPARTALVGNPSDGYGGAVVTLAVTNWAVDVELHAPLPGARGDRIDGPPGLVPIVEATRRVFRRRVAATGAAHLVVRTTIPREVGLAGSSAVVVATLDASSKQAGIDLDGRVAPALALRVETEELGIPGGLQDRVAQVWGGLVLCDARPEVCAVEDGLVIGATRRLPAHLLPPLAIAWLPAGAQSSAVSQAGLRSSARHADRSEIFARLGALALRTANEMDQERFDGLGPAMVETMAARGELVSLHPAHRDLVERVAATGVAVNYSGSGGAVVAIVGDGGIDELLAAVEPVGAMVEPVDVAPARPGVT